MNARTQTTFAEPLSEIDQINRRMDAEEAAALAEYEALCRRGRAGHKTPSPDLHWQIEGAWDTYTRLTRRERPSVGHPKVIDYSASHHEDGRARWGW